MAGRVGPRIALISAILTLVAGAVGFVVVLMLGAFVLDEFDAYGEVPIPGSGRLHLPAGEVTINFHTLVTGSGNGNFPIPPLTLGITPPDGVPDPVVTESGGSTTTVNSDVRVASGSRRSHRTASTTSARMATSTATSTRNWRSAATRRRTGCCGCSRVIRRRRR